MNKVIFFIFAILIINSCESPTDNQISTKKNYTGEKSIDLNNDSIEDFSWESNFISNGQTTDEILRVFPKNTSEILFGNDIIEIGDTIKFIALAPSAWHTFHRDLASYRTNNGNWSGTNGTSYIAVKINISNSFHCGWIKLTVDTLNHKIIFNSSDYNLQANQNFIVK